jgi:PAS domain S-box-containing protein
MLESRSKTFAPPAETGPGDAVAGVLKDADRLWEAVCDTADGYVAVIDRAGIIRFCNRVEDGFTRDQVVGHSLVRFTLPESTALLLQALNEVFETGKPRSLETTVRRLTGELNYFALQLGPVMVDGRTVAIMAFCRSILPLKESEKALQRERIVLRRLLEIQERERQLISYEIHDGLAQYLTGALMHLHACQYAERTEPATRELDAGIRLVQAAVDEARRLIGGLRPPALDELGIAEAIESLVADARTEIPDVSFEAELSGERLPAALETTIFRIVQESLSNTRRHAAARSAHVRVACAGGRVQVRVSDDGQGFDPSRVPDDRFGLEGIRQRCRLLGVEPRIESAPGKGTTIDVSLPVQPETVPG